MQKRLLMIELVSDLGIPESAASLHRESIVVDGLYIGRWNEEAVERLCAGGVTAIHYTVAVWENFRESMEILALWHRRFEPPSERIMLVRTGQDIHDAKSAGKLGVILGFQNVTPIEDNVYLLSLFQQLGVRIVQLAYNLNSLAAGSSRDRVDGGLTEFGVLTVQELNRLGMLVDLSHVGDRSSMDAIEVSKQPVAITHANPRALKNTPRNKPDEMISRVAAKGGVIGASVLGDFLPSNYGDKPTLRDYLDVIDHLVNVAGIDHVGIGTDFTEGQPPGMSEWWYMGRMRKRCPPLPWPDTYPEGLTSIRYMPRVTAGLLARGYSAEDVQKILAGNFLRLFETVWPSR